MGEFSIPKVWNFCRNYFTTYSKELTKKEENRIWDKRSWEDRCNLMEINEVLSCNVKANCLTTVIVIESESLDYLLGK